LLSACRRSISALGASGPVPPWLKMHTPRRNDLPRVVLHHDLQALWAVPAFFCLKPQLIRLACRILQVPQMCEKCASALPLRFGRPQGAEIDQNTGNA
jgi:hypothetical protein